MKQLLVSDILAGSPVTTKPMLPSQVTRIPVILRKFELSQESLKGAKFLSAHGDYHAALGNRSYSQIRGEWRKDIAAISIFLQHLEQ